MGDGGVHEIMSARDGYYGRGPRTAHIAEGCKGRTASTRNHMSQEEVVVEADEEEEEEEKEG